MNNPDCMSLCIAVVCVVHEKVCCKTPMRIGKFPQSREFPYNLTFEEQPIVYLTIFAAS